MNKIKKLIKDNPITFIIVILALITCIFVPPDKEYISYFDIKTLSSLYCICMFKIFIFFFIYINYVILFIFIQMKCSFSTCSINIHV